MAVDAAVVAAAEAERRLTLDVHCGYTKVVLKILHCEFNGHDSIYDGVRACVCVCGWGDFLQHK